MSGKKFGFVIILVIILFVILFLEGLSFLLLVPNQNKGFLGYVIGTDDKMLYVFDHMLLWSSLVVFILGSILLSRDFYMSYKNDNKKTNDDNKKTNDDNKKN